MGNLNDRARPPARSSGVRACPLARAARPISRIVVAPLLLFLLLLVPPRPSSSSSSCRAAPTTTVVSQHAGRQAGKQYDGEAGRWRFAQISLSETNDQRPKGAFAGSSTDRQDKPAGRAALQRADHHPGCKGRVYGLGVDEEEVTSVDGGDRAGRPPTDREREKKKTSKRPGSSPALFIFRVGKSTSPAFCILRQCPSALLPAPRFALPALDVVCSAAQLCGGGARPGPPPSPPSMRESGEITSTRYEWKGKKVDDGDAGWASAHTDCCRSLASCCCCCSSPVPLSSSFSSPHLASPRAERFSLISSTSNLWTRSRLVSRPPSPAF